MAASYQRTRLRRSTRRAEKLTRSDEGGRFLDVAIELRVVAQELADGGIELIPGLPRLRPLAVHRIGGRLDCIARTIVGPPERHTVWYVGERQARIILDRDLAQTRTLLYSAEGGGKTVLGVQWLIWGMVLDVIAGIPGPRGKQVNNLATAPVREKVLNLVEKIGERIPIDSPREPKEGAWGTFYADRREIRFEALGHVIKLVATKKQSAATGSPVQSISARRSLDDELQDTAATGADPDIEARLRGFDRTERLGTATAKDSPGWRTFRDQKLSSPNWRIERIRFDENPFEWPSRWEVMRQEMSVREWQRRGLAMDVGPERMTYTAWDREQNLRPIPQIGAEDVTRDVLKQWGGNFSLLIGHDPGKLCDVSLMLKAYRLRGQARHVWYVVDELTTEQTTTEQHVVALLKIINEKWSCNLRDWRGEASQGKQAFIRADPYSNSGNDSTSPDRSVYTIFRKAGLTILPAAMTASVTEVKSARIPKDAGIGMVNSLLCNAALERRLFIACDDKRQPAAPKLVAAIEMSERNGDGEAEAQDKNKYDLSHWPATLRYALWALEKPRMSEAA